MYGVLPQTMTKKSAQFDDNHECIFFYSVPQTSNTVSVDITQATTVTKD